MMQRFSRLIRSSNLLIPYSSPHTAAAVARKLAILVLLILNSVTEFLAAFAAHDHCGHQQSMSAASQVTLESSAHDDQTPADLGTCSCDGVCHLMTAANLNTNVGLGLNRQHGPALMRAPADRWAA